MAPSRLFVATVCSLILAASPLMAGRKHKNSLPECGRCVQEKCPSLGPIKVADCPPDKVLWDECRCCSRCSLLPRPGPIPSSITKARGNPCDHFSCSRRQICMLNIQQLPVCVCPPEAACEHMLQKKVLERIRHTPGADAIEKASSLIRKRARICVSDGRTYPSKCHMKIASCHLGRKLKVIEKGSCRKMKREDYNLISGNYRGVHTEFTKPVGSSKSGSMVGVSTSKNGGRGAGKDKGTSRSKGLTKLKGPSDKVKKVSKKLKQKDSAYRKKAQQSV